MTRKLIIRHDGGPLVHRGWDRGRDQRLLMACEVG